MEIQPINRNYETVKGLTNEQIKQKRESLIKQWQVWYTGLIKVLREELIKKQKYDQKISSNNFKKELEKYQVNSVEYNNQVNTYNLQLDSMLTLQKNQMEELKTIVQKDWQSIKNTINNTYPKDDKQFKTQGDGNPIPALIIMGVVALFGFIAWLGKPIVDAVTKIFVKDNPPPPPRVDSSPIKTYDDIPLETSLDPITSVKPNTIPVETNKTKEINDNNEIVQSQDDSMEKIIGALLLKNNIKFVIPFRLRDIFRSLNLQYNESVIGDCLDVPITDLSRLSKTSCKDYIGFFSLDDLPSAQITTTNDNKILIKLDLSDKKIINSGSQKISVSEWVKDLADKRLGTSWRDQQVNGISAIEAINNLDNKSLSFELTSPKICNQNMKAQFATDNVVSFEATIAKNILFEGDYTYSLKFIDKNDSKKSIDIKSETINLKNYIENKNGAGNPESRLKNSLSMKGRGMFTKATSTKETLQNSKFGYYIENKAGDLWDMSIRRLGTNGCKPIYTAHCVDSKNGDITFSKAGFDTAIYRLETRYNMFDHIKGKDNIESNDYLDTLITRVNSATFARLSSKPELSNLYANNYPDGSKNKIDKLEGTGVYYSPDYDYSVNYEDPAPLTFSQVNIPNDINKESFSYLQQLASKVNEQNSISAQGKNLLIDLVSPSGTSPFTSTNVETCSKDKFLHVGAVIDLTNQNFDSNIYVEKFNQSIPLNVIIKNSQDKVVKTYFFNAKIGKVNIFQDYWDGRIDQTNDNDADIQLDYLPDYVAGTYKVSVAVDSFRLDRENLYNGFNKVGITVPYTLNKKQSEPDVGPSEAIINISEENSCQESFNQDVADDVEESLADLIIEMDNTIASGPGFSIAATAAEIATDLDYKLLYQRVKEMEDAIRLKNVSKIKSSINQIRLVGQRILANEAIGTATWAGTTIALTLAEAGTLTFGPSAAITRGFKAPELKDGLVEATHEASFILKSSYTTECKTYGDSRKLSTMRSELRGKISDLKTKYKNATDALGQSKYGTFDNYAEKLEIDLQNLFVEIYDKSNEFSKECDECMKKHPNWDSKENLECRINKMSKGDRDKFRETLNIRNSFATRPGRTLKNLNFKTIAFGITKSKLDSSENFIVSISGEDKDSDKTTISYNSHLKGKIVNANVAKDPKSLDNTVFKTRKTIRGDIVVNDAEIKIFDYIHKRYNKVNGKKIIDLQNVFSDRVTCEYCRDVVRRIGKGEKISAQIYKKSNRSDAIYANFDLFGVGGKPLYLGEKIEEPKYLMAIDILSRLP